jgi:hypothetical protein
VYLALKDVFQVPQLLNCCGRLRTIYWLMACLLLLLPLLFSGCQRCFPILLSCHSSRLAQLQVLPALLDEALGLLQKAGVCDQLLA